MSDLVDKVDMTEIDRAKFKVMAKRRASSNERCIRNHVEARSPNPQEVRTVHTRRR